jgi:Holliday junction DNA helicase RuvA
MIGRLRGELALVEEDHVLIDVAGVGYEVHCDTRTLAGLPPRGTAVELWIDTAVREDAITLYGFALAHDRFWFRALQDVQGVGARVALAVLGVAGPDDLALAVAAQDAATVRRAPGVGPKLAERIVRELKGKTVAPAPPPAPTSTPAGANGADPLADALSALTHLGYGRSEAYAALRAAHAELGPTTPLDALIKDGLKRLAGGPA